MHTKTLLQLIRKRSRYQTCKLIKEPHDHLFELPNWHGLSERSSSSAGGQQQSTKPPHNLVHIAENATSAIANHDRVSGRAVPPIAIYTDGSRVGKTLGAAAISDALRTNQRVQLSATHEHAVEIAELTAIKIATEMAVKTKFKEFVIFTDSQAALHAIQKQKQRRYSDLVHEVKKNLETLLRTGRAVCLHWIPGHKGVAGNEAADQLAKEAIGTGK